MNESEDEKHNQSDFRKVHSYSKGESRFSQRTDNIEAVKSIIEKCFLYQIKTGAFTFLI